MIDRYSIIHDSHNQKMQEEVQQMDPQGVCVGIRAKKKMHCNRRNGLFSSTLQHHQNKLKNSLFSILFNSKENWECHHGRNLHCSAFLEIVYLLQMDTESVFVPQMCIPCIISIWCLWQMMLHRNFMRELQLGHIQNLLMLNCLLFLSNLLF